MATEVPCSLRCWRDSGAGERAAEPPYSQQNPIPNKTLLAQFQLFTFYKPACLQKYFHGRLLPIRVFCSDGRYLVNKPLRAAGMSADDVRRLRDCSKNEYLAEKRSFEGKYEILRTISQPRTLSANIAQARKGFIYFITLPLIFISYLNRTQKASVDLKTIGRNC